MSIFFNFESVELPRLLNVTNILPPPPPNTRADELPRIDLSPIRDFNLTLCVAKEWHRFSSHYLVPDGVAVEFVKSEFDGVLPGHFKTFTPEEKPGATWWLRPETRIIPDAANDQNREELSLYVRFLIVSVKQTLKEIIRFRCKTAIISSISTSLFTLHPRHWNPATLLTPKHGSASRANRSWTHATLVFSPEHCGCLVKLGMLKMSSASTAYSRTKASWGGRRKNSLAIQKPKRHLVKDDLRYSYRQI